MGQVWKLDHTQWRATLEPFRPGRPSFDGSEDGVAPQQGQRPSEPLFTTRSQFKVERRHAEEK